MLAILTSTNAQLLSQVVNGSNFLNIFANHIASVETAVQQLNTVGSYERAMRSLNTIAINARDDEENQLLKRTARHNIE